MLRMLVGEGNHVHVGSAFRSRRPFLMFASLQREETLRDSKILVAPSAQRTDSTFYHYTVYFL